MPRYLPYLICLLASVFYLYEFVLQVSPSVMVHELMRDFGIGAMGVSVISAFYYYAYTPMQVVAGLLYDRFGPRRVLAIAIIICAMGAFFFSMTHSIAMASAGRFLMGMGSAFSFIGALMLVARWFPANQFAFMAGIVQFMSAIGAISGQIPVAAIVNTFGWRSTLFWMAIIGVALAIVVWVVVRDLPPGMTIKSQHKGELSRLRHVCGKLQTWMLGLYAFTSWGPVAVFAALWGIPYMAERYHVSTTVASSACAMIWLGVGIGSPVFGWWSDKIRKRRPLIILCPILLLVSACSLLYLPSMSFGFVYLLLFLLGLGACGQAMSFAVIKDRSALDEMGTATGLNNMMTVLGGALLQPLAGFIMRYFWDGKYFDGAPVYTVPDYVMAMCIIPVCAAIALILSIFFIKESLEVKR